MGVVLWGHVQTLEGGLNCLVRQGETKKCHSLLTIATRFTNYTFITYKVLKNTVLNAVTAILEYLYLGTLKFFVGVNSPGICCGIQICVANYDIFIEHPFQ